MIERRGGSRLPEKALFRLFVVHSLGLPELESHDPAKLEIFGLVDNAHAALAELGENSVVADAASYQDGEIVPPDYCLTPSAQGRMPYSC